jgi:hypothetical protein
MVKIFALSAVLAVTVAINVKQYQRADRLLESLQDAAAAEPLKPGDRVPFMEGRNREGARVTVVSEQATRPQIIYWTSATCSWSARNEERFRHLWRTQRDRYEIVVVAAAQEDVAVLENRAHEPYTIVGPPPSAALKEARLRGTPVTLVVDQHGIVLGHWNGAYFGEVQRQIEAFFGIVMPQSSTDAKDASSGS